MTRSALSTSCAIWLAFVSGPAAALMCSVEFTPDGGFVTIQGFAQTENAAAVDYIVKVETRSASGVSVSQQGGTIQTPGGGAKTPLARSIINRRPDATVVVDIEVRADGDTASCDAQWSMGEDKEL